MAAECSCIFCGAVDEGLRYDPRITTNGFMCDACYDLRLRSRWKSGMRKTSNSRTSKFETVLAIAVVSEIIAQCLFGDSREQCCNCGSCQEEWIANGWKCPLDFFERQIIKFIDKEAPHLKHDFVSYRCAAMRQVLKRIKEQGQQVSDLEIVVLSGPRDA